MSSEDWPITSFQDDTKISPSPSLTAVRPFNPELKGMATGPLENYAKDNAKLDSIQQTISPSTSISPIHLSVSTIGTVMSSNSLLSTTNAPSLLSPSMLLTRNKISDLPTASGQSG